MEAKECPLVPVVLVLLLDGIELSFRCLRGPSAFCGIVCSHPGRQLLKASVPWVDEAPTVHIGTLEVQGHNLLVTPKVNKNGYNAASQGYVYTTLLTERLEKVSHVQLKVR